LCLCASVTLSLYILFLQVVVSKSGDSVLLDLLVQMGAMNSQHRGGFGLVESGQPQGVKDRFFFRAGLNFLMGKGDSLEAIFRLLYR